MWIEGPTAPGSISPSFTSASKGHIKCHTKEWKPYPPSWKAFSHCLGCCLLVFHLRPGNQDCVQCTPTQAPLLLHPKAKKRELEQEGELGLASSRRDSTQKVERRGKVSRKASQRRVHHTRILKSEGCIHSFIYSFIIHSLLHPFIHWLVPAGTKWGHLFSLGI